MKKNQKIVSIVFALSCLFNQKVESGALHDAVREGNVGEVTRLLNRPCIPNNHSWPANPNKKNDAGYTPLMLAVMNKKKECFKALLNDERTDLGICDSNGRTVIHWIMVAKDIAFLKLTGKCQYFSSYVNVKDVVGNSPLHLVSDRDMASYLIENGADLTIKNTLNKTPQEYLKDLNNKVLAEFLQQRYIVQLIKNENRNEIRKLLQKRQDKESGKSNNKNRRKRKNDEVEKSEICQFCQEEIEQVSAQVKFENCKHLVHHECQQSAVKNGYNDCTICKHISQKTSAAALEIMRSDEEFAQNLQRQFYDSPSNEDTDTEGEI